MIETRSLDATAVLVDDRADVVQLARGRCRALQPVGRILGERRQGETSGASSVRAATSDAAAEPGGPLPSLPGAGATDAHPARWPIPRANRGRRPGSRWPASIPGAPTDTRCRPRAGHRAARTPTACRALAITAAPEPASCSDATQPTTLTAAIVAASANAIACGAGATSRRAPARSARPPGDRRI